MQLTISFKSVHSSEELKDFITEKSHSLEKYFHGAITVTWVLSAEKLDRIAHCHLVGNNMNYFGEGTAGDHKASVDIALHKLETQIRKHKEIVTNHHHHHQKPKQVE
jgi:putative sigma-54 modulation protein